MYRDLAFIVMYHVCAWKSSLCPFFIFIFLHSSTDAIAALCFVLQQFQPRRWKHRFSYPRSANSAWCGKTSVVLSAVKQRGCSWHTGRSHSTQASVWTTGEYEVLAACNFAGLVTACSWDKSETEQGPEHACRINTQGSALALEIRNTRTTTKTESPMVTLTWHACKYKVHKLHQRL